MPCDNIKKHIILKISWIFHQERPHHTQGCETRAGSRSGWAATSPKVAPWAGALNGQALIGTQECRGDLTQRGGRTGEVMARGDWASPRGTSLNPHLATYVLAQPGLERPPLMAHFPISKSEGLEQSPVEGLIFG